MSEQTNIPGERREDVKPESLEEMKERSHCNKLLNQQPANKLK